MIASNYNKIKNLLSGHNLGRIEISIFLYLTSCRIIRPDKKVFYFFLKEILHDNKFHTFINHIETLDIPYTMIDFVDSDKKYDNLFSLSVIIDRENLNLFQVAASIETLGHIVIDYEKIKAIIPKNLL